MTAHPGMLAASRSETADEWQAAMGIRRVLDRGTEALPFRVTERLAQARQRALSRVLDPAPGQSSAVRPAVLPAPDEPSGWWRFGAAAASLVALVGAFVVVDAMQEDRSVEDLAEVDAALLTDEVPLDAYADRGFGVYLVNTRAPQQLARPVSLDLRR